MIRRAAILLPDGPDVNPWNRNGDGDRLMARKRLFKRIAPGVRGLDGLGQLERFLDTLDTGFDNATDKIRGMLTLHDVDAIEDKYLPLLAPAVGHRWRSDRTYEEPEQDPGRIS